MRQLCKTTLVIWTEKVLPSDFSLEDLGREAERGCAYCSYWHSESVADPTTDKYWDGTEFFGAEEDPGPQTDSDARSTRPKSDTEWESLLDEAGKAAGMEE